MSPSPPTGTRRSGGVAGAAVRPSSQVVAASGSSATRDTAPARAGGSCQQSLCAAFAPCRHPCRALEDRRESRRGRASSWARRGSPSAEWILRTTAAGKIPCHGRCSPCVAATSVCWCLPCAALFQSLRWKRGGHGYPRPSGKAKRRLACLGQADCRWSFGIASSGCFVPEQCFGTPLAHQH